MLKRRRFVEVEKLTPRKHFLSMLSCNSPTAWVGTGEAVVMTFFVSYFYSPPGVKQDIAANGY